jgi:hypothetical protein
MVMTTSHVSSRLVDLLWRRDQPPVKGASIAAFLTRFYPQSCVVWSMEHKTLPVSSTTIISSEARKVITLCVPLTSTETALRIRIYCCATPASTETPSAWNKKWYIRNLAREFFDTSSLNAAGQNRTSFVHETVRALEPGRRTIAAAVGSPSCECHNFIKRTSWAPLGNSKH